MRYLVYLIPILLLSCNSKQNSSSKTAVKAKPTKKEVNVKTVSKEKDNQLKNIKTVLGIDVSHFQGNVNWNQIKQDGVLFAYAKATQGAYYTDPKYKENWNNMAKYNLYKGAYHFYVYQDDAKKQAEHFLNTISYSKLDLPPVIDLESGGLDGYADVATLQKDVMVWLNTVEKALGVKPIIYTNVSYANTYLNNSKFGTYELWLAEYTKGKPMVPNAWKTKGWSIWQRSESGLVKGVDGNVDHDIFNGDFDAFRKEFFKN